MTKMNFLHLHRPDESLKTYRELLTYTKVRPHTHVADEQNSVTRNYADKSINNILDYVAGEGKVGHKERSH
jgi:COP9 signalosome complex subunit 2